MNTNAQAGTNIGGYILDSYVGGGSFGAVWRGHSVKSGQPVAVKLLTGALSTNETAAMRADVELLAASAASRSAHVVHVLDGGIDPVPHIVMEYIEGQDLSALLKEKGKLSPEQTIDVAEAISDALAVLNEAGIIHRDIKPANVMIDREGVIKLADFGIAKIVGYETVTMTGQTAMTMAYAAPEIWDEGRAFGSPSHKSDLYAMGVLLYQCIAGETPFRGNYGALYKAHTERTPDTKVLPPETPPSLRNLIELCLEKKQEDRPTDALECIEILERARAEMTGHVEATEPHQFGPWIKDAPHPTQPWAWHCHHESNSSTAIVEVHFADSLDYGDLLHRALVANAKLTSLGVERLLDANRLLLRPNESWQDAPAGRFQFWVAREHKPVMDATTVTAPVLVSAVNALADLLDAAAANNIVVSPRGNTTVLANGDVYVRRPGLVAGPLDANYEAMELILNLPLDHEATRIARAAGDFPSLVRSLATDSTVDRALVHAVVDHDLGIAALANDQTTIFTRTSWTERPQAIPAPVVVAKPVFAPMPNVRMELTRTNKGSSGSWYDLALHNPSPRPVELNLDAYDRKDTLSFSLRRLVTLAGNGTEHIRVRVESHKRGIIKRKTNFIITASGGNGSNEPPITIEGEFEDSSPLFAGAAVFGIAALAIAGGAFLMTQKHDSGNKNAAHLASATKVELPDLPIPVAVAPIASTAAPEPVAAAAPVEQQPDPPAQEIVVPEAPVYVPPPAPAPEANRANCAQIRGTNYLSGTEASWYRANCSSTTTTTTTTVSAPAQKTSGLVGLSITGGNGSTHRVGEYLTLCYTSKANQRIRVYDTATPGTLMRAGVDDGKGECFQVMVTLPTGLDSIRIDALNNNGTAVVDYAQLSIIVVQ